MNSSSSRRPGSLPRDNTRGSVLIVALIFAAIIAISIGSYLQLAQSSLRVANRAFYANAAINLAESGLEHAIWSVNKMADTTPTSAYNWAGDGWSVDGDDAYATFTDFTYDQNATGSVRVRVIDKDGNPSAPTLLARATIQPASGEAIEKWILVELSKRSLWANGLVAKKTIMFSGNNPSVDSYDSRLGEYGGTNRFDRGSAASGSVLVDSFNLGNADIWGYVSIGTKDYNGLKVGPNGTVAKFGSAVGTVDYTRVTTDFTPNLEDVDPPNFPPGPVIAITGAHTLTGGQHKVSSISLSGNSGNVLEINDDVEILITATTGTGVSVGGQASIRVNPGASLKIYTSADVAIAGNGLVNAGKPEQFQLYSTKQDGSSGTQNISISGNGVLSAAVYAPNADVTMTGGGTNGHIYGAVVANTIKVTGNSAFHFDEALADFTDGNPYGITSWQELTTAAARAGVVTKLNF